MITGPELRQAWTIARLEIRRAFFSKRSFWIYILAIFPAIIFFGHAISLKYQEKRYASRGMITAAQMDSIAKGESIDRVVERLPAVVEDHRYEFRRGRRGPRGPEEERVEEEHRTVQYYDGKRRAWVFSRNGVVQEINIRQLKDFESEREAFAGVFQYFYLRLAIFFGCLGIFINLFRGEMMDKTLHFWFLIPVKRSVLLLGKYMAGFIAAAVIFSGGALLAWWGMLWPQDSSAVNAYLAGSGYAHLSRYLLAAVLGCLGYGSVFLAAGLLLRNPIIPAVVILIWEGINGFLPDILQKLSVLFYLQSVCPTPAPIENDVPPVLRLLIAPAEPVGPAMAVLGLLMVTAIVLFAAAQAVRKLEINYSTD
ncbi:MAG: ABC transporter permease subunit [Bryobacteraceae bacterium]|nr:ABC transporter permease subunit [Bryobacteraceae bacterium]